MDGIQKLLGSKTAKGAVVAVAVVLGVSFAAWRTCGFDTCPDVGVLRSYQPGGAPVLLDRHGEPFADLAPLERNVVSLRALPPHVAEAFLAVEDQRFYEHGTVDWRRVVGAALANLRSGGIAQGFSTISMQLARSVFPDRLPAERRTVRRKLLEIRVAGDIEEKYTKQEILELYLNHVYMGAGTYGIENAARRYFGVPARKLTLAQSAMLAGLVRSPGRYDPRNHPKASRERRDFVLAKMQEQGRAPESAVEQARRAPVVASAKPADRRIEAGLAPYVVEQVRRALDGGLGERLSDAPATIRTTISSRIQRAAEEELRAQLRAIERGAAGDFDGPVYDPTKHKVAADKQIPYLQGAVVVLEAQTGDVLAWVGGRDFSISRYDHVALAHRQAGSAFKPFVYAAAVEQGFALSQPLDDSPVTIELANHKIWRPRNVRDRHDGRISIRDALVRSNNTATVRLAQQLGLDHIAEVANRVSLAVNDVQPALALGAVEVTPLQLTAAYTAFANNGIVATPRLILDIDDADGEKIWTSDVETRRSMDDSTAYLVTDVLADAIRNGTGRPAYPQRVRVPAAGKTGTTNDVTDAWFVGFTPELVAGVWIGFDQPRPIVDEATAARLAAPLWSRLVDRIYDGYRTPQPWSVPDDVRTYAVDANTGMPLASDCEQRVVATQDELFIHGLSPTPTCPGGRRRFGESWFTSWKDRIVETAHDLAATGGKLRETLAEQREARRQEREQARETDRSADRHADDEPAPRLDDGPADERALPRDVAPRGRVQADEDLSEEVAFDTEDRERDLSGWWNLNTRIESTSVAAYRDLRLGYRIQLEQYGDRVRGRGQKWSENGRPLAGAGRTAIELTGNVQNGQVTLAFREHGARRTSGGTIRFRIAPDAQLQGNFRSTAADTSGSAVATRLR